MQRHQHYKPFFGDAVVSNTNECHGKRLLLVSYHFPPATAVGGVRWLAFASYFAERGWRVDVLCRDPKALARRDDERLASLAKGVQVFAVPEPRASLSEFPLRLWKLRRRNPNVRSTRVGAVGRAEVTHGRDARAIVRAYFAWLDFAAMGQWARAAAALGSSLAQANPYDLIASSGPPHLAHHASWQIARQIGAPLIVDFRDPWSFVERVPEHIASPLWFSLASRHEARIVADAALIVMNTEPSRDVMCERYPELADRIVTIRNGSDDASPPIVESQRRFTIRYAGSIYLDRDPRLVFRAAARVIRELKLTPEDFGLCFIGDAELLQGLTIAEMAAEESIGEFVELGPPRPRSEAMRFLAEGSMLLSLPQDSHLAVPAKIFEYVQFPAWLLILAERESATARLLEDSEADVVSPTDVDAMARVIKCHYEEFRRGVRPLPVGRDGGMSRRRQAQLLFERVSSLASGIGRRSQSQ